MKNLFLLLFFLASLSELALSQSTITVGLGPTPQTINLGLFGDKTVTQITFVCMTASSNYKWAIDAPWQTTTGKINTFTTTTNTITIVPIPGYAGCAGGSVGVSSGGASQLSVRDKAGVPIQNATFSYIAGLNQPAPYITVARVGTAGQNGNVTIYGTNVVNYYSPGVSYSTWSLTNNNNPNYLYYAQSTGNQQGLIYSMPAASYLTTYNATINTTVSIAGSSGCTGTLTRNLIVHPNVDPIPGTINGCYDFSQNEVDCYTGKETGTTSVYPNPATKDFIVYLQGSAQHSVYLYDKNGVLMGAKENVTDNVTWDTSGLQKGTYVVKIINGHGSKKERLVIE